MSRKIILIGVDHKWRDLPGYAYLAELLEKKYNHKVILVRNYDEVKYWQAFKPNVIIINHLLEKIRREWIKRLPPQIKVIILPTEGITTYTKNMANLLGGEREEYKYITALLSWIDFLEEYWHPGCFLDKEKIIPIGIPRFDFFFNSKIRSVFKSPEHLRKKLKIPYEAKVITFFLNFVYATVADRNIKLWKKILIDQGYNPRPYIKIAYKDLKAREKFISTIKKLIKTFSDYIFLIKPHPNEDFYFYKKYLNKISNLKIVPNLYSIEALSISDLVVQRRCITGLEAAILNKPAIDYTYQTLEAYDGDLVKGIWPQANTEEELFDLIACWRRGNFKVWEMCRKEREERLRKWVSLNKGKATEKAAEVIDKIANETVPYSLYFFEILRTKFRYYIISLLKDIYRKIFPDRWGRYSKAPNFLDFWVWRYKVKRGLFKR